MLHKICPVPFVPKDLYSLERNICYLGATPSAIQSLFLIRRTKGADKKIAQGLPAVIGKVAGSGAGKRI